MTRSIIVTYYSEIESVNQVSEPIFKGHWTNRLTLIDVQKVMQVIWLLRWADRQWLTVILSFLLILLFQSLATLMWFCHFSYFYRFSHFSHPVDSFLHRLSLPLINLLILWIEELSILREYPLFLKRIAFLFNHQFPHSEEEFNNRSW